jgi:hypothetical protein
MEVNSLDFPSIWLYHIEVIEKPSDSTNNVKPLNKREFLQTGWNEYRVLDSRKEEVLQINYRSRISKLSCN